jgi:hypothetical protein
MAGTGNETYATLRLQQLVHIWLNSVRPNNLIHDVLIEVGSQ